MSRLWGLRALLLAGGAGLLLLAIAAPVAWYLISPLFLSKTVDEGLPATGAAATTASSTATVAETTTAGAAVTTSTTVTGTNAAAPAAGQPVALRSGRFHGVDHHGVGMATIHQLPDGKRVLRFEDFDVQNGPDLYVYLSAAPDANDDATIQRNRFVSLGRLKGNRGNQNYELPDDLDLGQFNSVSIWCQRFSVNFATAPLK